MGRFAVFRHAGGTMRRKLFGYMLLLGLLLLLGLIAGLFLFGRFNSDKKNTSAALDLQMAFFEKDIATHFDYLAAGSIELSESTTLLLENTLADSGLSFRELNDNAPAIGTIQKVLFEALRSRLAQENCSGVFVMLDATVNTAIDTASVSRTGLYLQRNGYGSGDESLSLYRGGSELGEGCGIPPHRKWRLEFRTDMFPDYAAIAAKAYLPLSEAYCLTALTELPGTADRVMLMTVPIVGTDGSFYGLCGYEISASHFMSQYAQPSNLPHLTFLLSPSGESGMDTAAALSCGLYRDYYRPPVGVLHAQDMGDGLCELVGEQVSYVGVRKDVSLTPNNRPYTLSVMMPMTDFTRAGRSIVYQNLILLVLLLFFAVSCCLFFSHRYLQPILAGIEQIKSRQRTWERSSLPEINDLFAFLAEQDRRYEQSLHALRREKQSMQQQYAQAQMVYAQAQQEYDKAQQELSDAKTEVERLAYARKTEIDPGDYEHFLAGIYELTKTERDIFELYLEGKTAKEIQELFGIKEGTLKFHNHNILNKLGVSSRKQMLRYAALMKQQEAQRAALRP